MAESLVLNFTLQDLEEISKVNRITREIDGWLTELEGAALYIAAKYGPGKGAVVEIGSFKGKSTIWLARGNQRVGRERIYAIDTHLGSPEHQVGETHASHMPIEGTTKLVFRQNIRDAQVDDWVVPLVMSSDDALRTWRDPVRLLFIDADHAHNAVRNDFLGWENHVVVGGLVAFHDVDRLGDYPGKVLDGPTKVVYEDVARTNFYSEPVVVNHLAFVTKVRQPLS